ncbi:MAG: NfeD family protein [Gammaproteobacteria bacterium]|nr:NfeD family protein [Gammaproteobacteria bacterium]MDH3434741.1 NfeD family protein [Gammaproteobacteria bacterium]
MTWWSWMILGAVLLGAELFAVDAQFYLVFLGVSAAIVGLAGLFGLVAPEWVQWLAFAVLSLVFFLTFRRTLYLKIRGGGEEYPESISGDSVSITEDLAAGAEARMEYRGTKWTIRNVGNETISGGTRAKVVKVDGLTLHVIAE